ncbi:MAG: hypothetical protein ACWGO1_11040 [Anaerolineales bacterium]
MKGKLTKIILYSVLGLTLICAGVLAFLALSNRSLPTRSEVVDRLSDLDKARLAEATYLQHTLGDLVWQGWGQLDTPYIVYNEDYAFLIGYADPPDGWVKMPQNEQRGGAWEPVPNDTFQGAVYYRQRLTDPQVTPENFTVLVGERWVATLQTKEYSLVSFVQGFSEQLPPGVRSIFPYRLMWGQLVGQTENYIGALLHEAFHAYQGTFAAKKLAEAERVARLESSYPWDDPMLNDAWQQELDLLLAAVRSESDSEAAEKGRQFLARRYDRRASAGLSAELVDYERQREWLEGLAKYAELKIGLAAQDVQAYEPVPEVRNDPDFNGYKTRLRYWQGQLNEVNNLSNRSGETRFYYGGMAQAVLLDRLAPDWKMSAFNPGATLEDLLRQAVE